MAEPPSGRSVNSLPMYPESLISCSTNSAISVARADHRRQIARQNILRLAGRAAVHTDQFVFGSQLGHRRTVFLFETFHMLSTLIVRMSRLMPSPPSESWRPRCAPRCGNTAIPVTPPPTIHHGHALLFSSGSASAVAMAFDVTLSILIPTREGHVEPLHRGLGQRMKLNVEEELLQRTTPRDSSPPDCRPPHSSGVRGP